MVILKKVSYTKSLYSQLIEASRLLEDDIELMENSTALRLANRKLQKNKKKLKEKSYGSPAGKMTYLLFYTVIMAVIFSILLAFVKYRMALYVFGGIFAIGAFIVMAVANKNKYTNSPLVRYSLYHKLFVGGSNTKWYNFDCELINNMYMDLDNLNNPVPVIACFISFIPKTDENVNNYILSEITEEEYLMYKQYDFNKAAIAICDNDVVDILFFKEGLDYIEALPKISKK